MSFDNIKLLCVNVCDERRRKLRQFNFYFIFILVRKVINLLFKRQTGKKSTKIKQAHIPRFYWRKPIEKPINRDINFPFAVCEGGYKGRKAI